ncbi:hydroxylamine reductase [Thiotrichales bacterium 19S11-10]|nr:hydroxylamine reductase [Thiotrichales bacterium 19S11-10]
MLCLQCEQTKRDDGMLGCADLKGACGKDATTSDLQDILIYQVIGLSQLEQKARGKGIDVEDVDKFIKYAMFTTLTNVNFSITRFQEFIKEAHAIKEHLLNSISEMGGNTADLEDATAGFIPKDNLEDLVAQASVAGMRSHELEIGEDANGLWLLTLYGLKGVCAYAHHAQVLGFRDDQIDAEICKQLAKLATPSSNLEPLFDDALKSGELNVKVLELLDKANTESFGVPDITQVRVSPVKGKAILVSGHDLKDLADLLEQTKDLDVNVYTHGEMLPAHAYPKLKSYSHFIGNYGGAWQDQQREFLDFPGAILITSNCLIEPDPRYRQRLFTTGPVGWSGIRHINNHDFSPVIQAAKALPGFVEDEDEKLITTGFNYRTVLSLADTVISAIKNGDIKRFFVIGGCDGAKPGRNYYTDLAEQTPKDTVILTVGCAKYRFNKQDHGDIGGIPRLLDMGQCNDSYSAVKVALALADAFKCDINELPLSLMISWFEQKATAVLLSLLSLGVKGIHLGPSLPVYLTPTLLSVLQDKFDIKVNGVPSEDIKRAMSNM